MVPNNIGRRCYRCGTDLLQDFVLFRNALFVEERDAGLTRLRQLDLQGQEVRTIAVMIRRMFVAGYQSRSDNPEFRYGYASLTTPTTHYALDIVSGERKMLKRQPVLGDFKPEHYQSQRLWVAAVTVRKFRCHWFIAKIIISRGKTHCWSTVTAPGMSEEPYFASSA